MNKKEKQFSDKQVSLIIKRAVELQKKELKTGTPVGLSSKDLEKIAAEAGIDQVYIHKAISELEEGTLEGKKTGLQKFLGHESRIILNREIDKEVPVSKYEELLPVIQKTAGIAGNHSLLGNTFTWRVDNYQTGQVMHVMISSKNGKTTIEAKCNMGQIAGGIFGGIMGGLGGGAGIGAGVPLAITIGVLFPGALVLIGAIGGSYLLSRLIYHAIYTSYKKKMDRIMKDITARIESD